MERAPKRPRYFAGSRQNSATSASASCQTNTAEVPGEQQPFSVKVKTTKPVVNLDFAVGAKHYKKQRQWNSAARGAKISFGLMGMTIVSLGAIGFWLNNTYSGRALPFSYVGGISVGGLTQEQIKKALDARTKEIKITFVDGGLKHTVPASAFGATFDTEAAAKQIVPDFNPFAFLDRRSIEVPVKINDYQVDGYMRLYVHPTQSTPADAKIIKDKTKLAIAPGRTGFRTDPKFVATSLRASLGSLQDPLINLNAVTLKPQISDKDLQDDLLKANRLLGTNVTVSYGYSMNVITPAQKLAWLQFDTSIGTKDLNVNFSRALVRQHVLNLAKKYQKPAPVAAATPATAQTTALASAAPAQTTPVIDNIDEVTDAIVAALNNGQATAQKFVASSGGQGEQNTPVVATRTINP